jgi:hypothetical protein
MVAIRDQRGELHLERCNLGCQLLCLEPELARLDLFDLQLGNPPVVRDASFGELLSELPTLMTDLDELVVDVLAVLSKLRRAASAIADQPLETLDAVIELAIDLLQPQGRCLDRCALLAELRDLDARFGDFDLDLLETRLRLAYPIDHVLLIALDALDALLGRLMQLLDFTLFAADIGHALFELELFVIEADEPVANAIELTASTGEVLFV